MTNRAAKSLLCVSACVAAGASIASIFVTTAGAADECLAKPKAAAPSGQHWYYRHDRGTKRQCWYLRDKDETSSQASIPAPSEKAVVLDRNNETSLARSTADAYAALSSPGGQFAPGSQIPPVTQTPSIDPRAVQQDPPHEASSESEQSPVASRWPDSTGELSPVIERPATSSVSVASTTPDSVADAGTASVGSVVSANQVDAPASDVPVSLWMLLMAAFGALAFSAFIGGLIYFAHARRRSQPDDDASRWPGWSPPDDAYRLYAPASLRPRSVKSPPIANANPVDRLASGFSENGQEIARLLARFAHQAEADR